MRDAVINLSAISSNVATLKRAVGGIPTLVVVKANGYGHGAVPSARAALDGGAEWLGVVDLDEAAELREAGITAPVLAWLHGPHAAFGEAIATNVDVGVSYLEQLELVAAAPGLAEVHLKVDTGLARSGAAEADWTPLFERAAELERAGAIHVRGFWSHLANTADDSPQVSRFASAIEAARACGLDPEIEHLAASAGALRMPEARFGLVRIGLSAYGLSPIDDVSSAELGLVPAMRVSADVVSVKRVPEGTGVSYGHAYTTETETSLALVPLGYADGIPRHASGAGPVWINGQTYRVAGRIAMDQIVIDVGDAPVRVGDRAVLFGDPSEGYPSAEDWAAASGTINYEIVTRIGHRVTRTYVP